MPFCSFLDVKDPPGSTGGKKLQREEEGRLEESPKLHGRAEIK